MQVTKLKMKELDPLSFVTCFRNNDAFNKVMNCLNKTDCKPVLLNFNLNNYFKMAILNKYPGYVFMSYYYDLG